VNQCLETAYARERSGVGVDVEPAPVPKCVVPSTFFCGGVCLIGGWHVKQHSSPRRKPVCAPPHAVKGKQDGSGAVRTRICGSWCPESTILSEDQMILKTGSTDPQDQRNRHQGCVLNSSQFLTDAVDVKRGDQLYETASRSSIQPDTVVRPMGS